MTVSHQTLDLSAAVGRYAVSYVRKVCAQAHVGFCETSPGEDVLAVDGLIQYPSIDLRVQIKGSTSPSLSVTGPDRTLSFAIGDGSWRYKWQRNGLPTYFIYVLMERDVDRWFTYNHADTIAGAVALWARVDNLADDATHVIFRRSDRFTPDTVDGWYQDVVRDYGGGI